MIKESIFRGFPGLAVPGIGKGTEMKYRLVKQIRDNPTLRQSFMDLAVKVFDLSFENWYRQGSWMENYIPYAIVDGSRVVANASVNIIDLLWKGAPKQYIQIGTVMTDPAYRNQGLSRKLLEEILRDWSNHCDCIYLFANSTVLDFYPKFGFQQAKEYKYTLPIVSKKGDFVKLDMGSVNGRKTLLHYFSQSNPYSLFSMVRNEGLLLFYCGNFMKDSVFYSSKMDVVCIAEQKQNGTLVCYDIFGPSQSPLEEILSALAAPQTMQAELGFTPLQANPAYFSLIDDKDDTLFLLSGKENIFDGQKIMFPTLSHA